MTAAADPAILLVDHGSRRPDANAQLEEIARLVRERAPGRVVEIAHMELADPTIPDGVAACVASGARSIVVLPYMLAPGRHAAGDIPRLARDAAAQHAGVTVRVSEPLGVHPGLALAVLDRVAEAVAAPADQADDPAE